MNIGAKEINRLRDWDDDYLEGFSEYLSEHTDSVDDADDTLICQTCNDGQMLTVWHTGFDRFVQVLLPFDKYRCQSCRATRWQFNHFKGFTASTFVLYAVSLALVLFFGTTTLGILLDRQSNDFSESQASVVGASEPVAANDNLTPVSADTAAASTNRFDEIVENPLSNTLFEPIDESRDAADEGGASAGVVLLPAAFRITFVPDAATPVGLEDQSLALPSNQEDVAENLQKIPVAPIDIALGDDQTTAVGSDAALNQSTNTAVPSGNIVTTDSGELREIDSDGLESSTVEIASDTSVESDLGSAISIDQNPAEEGPVEGELVEEAPTNGNVWLFGQAATSYTAQLGSFNNLTAAESFVTGNDLAVSNAHILETASNNKTWFYVLYGSFELQADAAATAQGLGFSDPLIRKFSGLQAKRCASWETANERAFNSNCR